MIGLPWVVGSWAFAAEPAVCGCVSDGFGSGCVVAFVVGSFVGSVGVDEGLVFGLAGWAAVASWGELAAAEAWAGDGHGVGGVGFGWGGIEVSALVFGTD